MAIKSEGPGVPDLLNACMRPKNLFMKLLWQWNCFYWWNCKDLHNWGFLESYIFAITEQFLMCWLVESYSSIREYRLWKWQSGGAICFPLSLWTIFWETSMGLGIKTVNIIVKKQINNNFLWCELSSTKETMPKCSKLCSETTHRSSWVWTFWHYC